MTQTRRDGPAISSRSRTDDQQAKPRGRAGRKEPTLPDSELEVLRVLWRRGSATARQVWSDLNARTKWTYATVNTLLQRLEAKELADCDKRKMSYVYAPRIDRQEVVTKRVDHLIDKLYDGKGGPLVMHLLQSQQLSREEVTEIRSLLEDADAGPQS